MTLWNFSWGSGANPWGPDKEDQFSTPNHWDGMLEVVGVSGVVHLGQIQSGLRQATRIAQVSGRVGKIQLRNGEIWFIFSFELVHTLGGSAGSPFFCLIHLLLPFDRGNGYQTTYSIRRVVTSKSILIPIYLYKLMANRGYNHPAMSSFSILH